MLNHVNLEAWFFSDGFYTCILIQILQDVAMPMQLLLVSIGRDVD